jgi:hypothetical protein
LGSDDYAKRPLDGEMNQPSDDRDRERIRAFWTRVERALRAYARFSAVRLLRLTNREGFYLAGASIALLGMTALASWSCIPNRWSYPVAVPAAYYVVDGGLVNTTITFISQQPIHRLRSVLLTLHNVLNVGLAYAVVYASQHEAFSEPLGAVRSVYFSFATLTTLGYGDIKPDGPGAWSGQVTVVLELITGLYFLAAVLSVVVAWAQQVDRRGRIDMRPWRRPCPTFRFSGPRARVARPAAAERCVGQSWTMEVSNAGQCAREPRQDRGEADKHDPEYRRRTNEVRSKGV